MSGVSTAGQESDGSCERCGKQIPAKNASGKRRKWCSQQCRQRQQKRCRSTTGAATPPTHCTVCARPVEQGRTKWRYFCSPKCQVYASRARRGTLCRRPSRLPYVDRQSVKGFSEDMRQEQILCELEGRKFDRKAFLAQNMPWQESVELDERIHF